MNLLLTGAVTYSDTQLKQLKDLGCSITFIQDERNELDIDCSIFEAVVCNGLFLYTPIEKFTNLKLIQLTSAGLDRVPIEYIKNHNIQIYNARGVYSVPMAEWVLLKVLEIYKKSFDFHNNQRQHLWNKQRDVIELCGKTACIVGAGSVGIECIKRFKAFDVTTCAVDVINPQSPFIDNFYNIDELEYALTNADIIVLTLPLTDKTKGLFNKKLFSCIKDNAVLVNVSRGGVINENDLISELINKKFMGVALDVFEQEPLNANSPLWNFENVIVTPHNSFVSENNSKRLFNITFYNINNYLLKKDV